MGRFGYLMAAVIGVSIPLSAQGLTVRTTEGEAVSHGEAAKAEPGDAAPDGEVDGDGKAVGDLLRELHDIQFADGDLTDDEINALVEKARERLEKDMAKQRERERRIKAKPGSKDHKEETAEITQARYRDSLRALERDLIYNIASLRKPGGDRFERPLDNLQDKIKDTFADLHAKIADGKAETWADTLAVARKFHVEFSAQVTGWADKIGVDPAMPNAKDYIVETKKALRDRLRRLRKLGGSKYESQLDALEERILDTYEKLEEKLEDTVPEGWAAIVKDADKFNMTYTAELDGWAKQIGVDDTLPGPLEQLADLKRDLSGRIDDLRRIGGGEHESAIDGINDSINDTFADLKDKLLREKKELHQGTLETATKFHKQFADTIAALERRIVGADTKIDRRFPEIPAKDTPRTDYPEKDIELPKGEVMDIVEGVRVARLMPLTKQQLGLDHGLSVNEIIDADKALARAGLEVYDIILTVNGTKCDLRTDLREALAKLERGTEYEIVIMRKGEKQTLKATK